MSPARVATVSAYLVLGSVLAASRIVGLDHSFWTDEILAVEEFVREGPREILTGPELSHQLFGILAWLTSTVVGESEVALRLLSVVPFVAAAALVTGWLHARVGALAGVVYLFLTTVSPLLLDIARQARGYGLAFLAMSVLVVAALEIDRSSRTSALVAFCAGGVVGTMTLPQVGIAFVAACIVLAARRASRKRVALGLTASLLAIGAWYAPHLGQVREAAQIEDGVQIETLWLPTAAVDQVLLPALIWIDGTALVAGVVWLPLVFLAVLVMAASPFARTWTSALILVAPPIATVIVLWFAQAYVIPRYLSYLLVPLFVLLASGMSTLVERWRSRSAAALALAGAVVAGLLVLNFASLAPEVMRLPREANRDAARVILASEPPRVAVLAYLRNSRNLAYYLGRPPVALQTNDVAARVCGSRELVVFVTQPFGIPTADVDCLERPGVRRYRFEQYARGGEMNVWFVPPS